MTTICMPYLPRPSSLTESNGVSEEAEFVVNQFGSAIRHLNENITSESKYDRFLDSLIRVVKQCTDPDWDGYGAKPVNGSSVILALQVINRLPASISQPDITCDPDGDVSLEWYRAPKRNFSISIAADGALNYAGLFGCNETFGTEYFFEELPHSILENVCRV